MLDCPRCEEPVKRGGMVNVLLAPDEWREMLMSSGHMLDPNRLIKLKTIALKHYLLAKRNNAFINTRACISEIPKPILLGLDWGRLSTMHYNWAKQDGLID